MTVPIMLTINEVREKTGFSYEFVRQLIRENKVVYVKAGKKFLINWEKLVEYLNKGDQEVMCE